jgi:exopolyphosphatase / guanosine-5'-triphosphate,3'-diphosphate pyrophosphatase
MTVTGRWEWRIFSRDCAGLAPKQTAGELIRPPTREFYVLSIASVHNVKVRDNCLDIKTLVRTDEKGLEQWQPMLKAPFPIGEAELSAAWSAWGLPHPVVESTRCTLDEFLSGIVSREPGLRAVEIEKRRIPMIIQGCPGERAIIKVGNQTWESLAFEHADGYRVWRAVRALGLENAQNTNYPAALKRIVGFQLAGQPEEMEPV